ncbi:TonB-dependent receptor [Sphingomonas immobilis]|uniref:TonB-dependent receptor n=1 Tax=Sphingomonas immobilis TaxID=3063997 RepID=A0ABT8ZVH7_9SPHN|nr:TonB-dependent receptor [Sphingomonas sp. CA1-15]MDO7840756.1 TonB-dependent receptor [Sphingomonas sp. CA1-15]
MIRTRFFARAGVSLVALGVAAAAQAQDAPDAAEVVVTGQRASQIKSIDAKRDAIGVVDVSASDDIGRLPDRNVAEVVEHLAGVGVTYDQGEGRYVAIRGVPSALNGYTFDGMQIGNTDGTTRALPLDIISGQLLARVEVAKVKTADMDGQGIGGNINLVTMTAFDFPKAFNVSGRFQAGYQELNKKVPIQGDLSVAARFGPDQQFGIVLGGSYSDRDFYSQGFYPDNWRPDARFARGGVPDNIKYTQYSLRRQRQGYTGSFDWKASDRQTFFVRGIYSKFTEDEIRPRYRLDFATAAIVNNAANGFVINPDGLTGSVNSGTQRREDLRLDYKSKWFSTGIVGGETDFDAVKLNYQGSYSHNELLDTFPIWQYRCNPGKVNFDFTDKVYSAAPVTECTANQLSFNSYTASRQVAKQDIWQGKIDGTYALGDRGFIKIGAKYQTTDQGFDASNPTWGVGSTAWSAGSAGVSAPGVCVYPNSNNTGQCYFNSPSLDPAASLAFTAANLNNPAFFKLNTATTLLNETLSDFSLNEKIYAGYAMANVKFGVVTITPGLRYEHTDTRVTGFALQNGTTVVPQSGRGSYDDFLPSLIVRIEPSSQTVFRLAYSRSVGRPEYASLNPGGSVDTINLAASFGNPNLKPYRADNLDATAEWYFAKGGLLSIGVFGKFIRNPIFTRTTVVTNYSYGGTVYPTFNLAQPFNADKGDIVGIEAQYQQLFTFLPGFWSGFGIQLTGTLTDSSLRLPSGRTSTFPYQSRYLYGAELFYQKGPVEASIAYHNTGKALLAVGDPAYNDQYNDDLRRLDAKASFGILKEVRIFFEAQNLTDEPTRQYQGGNTNWLIQNERYGRTFYAGVSAKF